MMNQPNQGQGQGQFTQQMGQVQMAMIQGQQLQQLNQGPAPYAMQGAQNQGMAGPWQDMQGGGGQQGADRGGGGASHTEEHRRQVLKQQQQRLLLLRHASKCPHEFGRCPVTPHCGSMKHLWKHIMTCKDQVHIYSDHMTACIVFDVRGCYPEFLGPCYLI